MKPTLHFCTNFSARAFAQLVMKAKINATAAGIAEPDYLADYVPMLGAPGFTPAFPA